MRVKATKTGFAGGSLRYRGDEFDMPEGSRATWFVAVEDGSVAPAGKPGRKRAETTGAVAMSQLTGEPPQSFIQAMQKGDE